MKNTILALLWLFLPSNLPVQAEFAVNTPVHSSDFDDEIAPSDNNLIRAMSGGRIGYIETNSWVRYANFDFGQGAKPCHQLTLGQRGARSGVC